MALNKRSSAADGFRDRAVGASPDRRSGKVAWEPQEERPPISRPCNNKSAAKAELRWYRGFFRPETFSGRLFSFGIRHAEFGMMERRLRRCAEKARAENRFVSTVYRRILSCLLNHGTADTIYTFFSQSIKTRKDCSGCCGVSRNRNSEL